MYWRGSLTPVTAYLVRRAKSDLKITDIYKFVWCKNGMTMARKTERDKIHCISSNNDIDRLVAQH